MHLYARVRLRPHGCVCRKEEAMAKIILTIPVRRVAPLSRVWIKTGNPAQPLVCKWISRLKSGTDLAATEADEPGNYRLCA